MLREEVRGWTRRNPAGFVGWALPTGTRGRAAIPQEPVVGGAHPTRWAVLDGCRTPHPQPLSPEYRGEGGSVFNPRLIFPIGTLQMRRPCRRIGEAIILNHELRKQLRSVSCALPPEEAAGTHHRPGIPAAASDESRRPPPSIVRKSFPHIRPVSLRSGVRHTFAVHPCFHPDHTGSPTHAPTG